MQVQSLRVQNFRNHSDREVAFGERVSIIIGANGSGKTSLLEALWILLRGKSFRGVDSHIIGLGAEWYRISATLSSEYSERSATYRLPGQKKFMVDSKQTVRLPQKSRYPIVMFEPDLLREFTGSPSRKRNFLDRLLSSLDTNYARALSRYDKALQQRNSLLKSSNSGDSIFAWDLTLSEYGSYLIESRQRLVAKINSQITEVYRSIASRDDQISLAYKPTYKSSINETLLKELTKCASRDRALGYTTVGPHRHDLEISFNGSDIRDIASRGEIRTVVLAIKFIETTLVEEILDSKPLILLDDVFGELDDTRQRELVHNFRDHQIIITSTALPKNKFDASVIQL